MNPLHKSTALLISAIGYLTSKVLERGRQESLPTILCEPDSFGSRSKPLKPVVIRECPHDSLGLLSPLRCFARLRSYPHTPDLSQKIIPQWFPAVSLRRFSFPLLFILITFIIKIIILFHHYYRFNQILWFVFHQHQRRFNILKAFEFMSNQLTGIQSSRDQK